MAADTGDIDPGDSREQAKGAAMLLFDILIDGAYRTTIAARDVSEARYVASIAHKCCMSAVEARLVG